MSKKSSHSAAIEKFIARQGVTKCPPAVGNARSLRQLRKEYERDGDVAITASQCEEKRSNALIDARIDHGTHVVNGLGELVYIGE